MDAYSSNLFELPNRLGQGAMAGAQPPASSNGGAADDMLSPAMMNDVINGLQSAQNSTLGYIPTRDIVTPTAKTAQDETAFPNYVPPPLSGSAASRDFVGDHVSRVAEMGHDATQRGGGRRQVRFADMEGGGDPEYYEEVRRTRRRQKAAAETKMDHSREQLFMMAGVGAAIYFLLEIPVVRGLFFRFMAGSGGVPTAFFDADGSIRTMGAFVKSLFFAAMFFAFMWFMN